VSGRLGGRVCVITGAAGGIGQEYARRFVAEGADVVVTDVDDLTETRRLCGGDTAAICADIRVRDDTERVVEAALSAHGRVDVLLNNAAFYGGITLASFDEIPEAEWDRAMDVNVKGLWQMTAAAVKVMRPRESGAVINVSSNVVFMGKPGFLHYVASKGAVWAMTAALARELGGTGINVNGLAPGYTITPATRGLADEDEVARLEDEILGAQSIKRLIGPSDLTGAAVFLASEDAAFVTGQTLVVDGGVVPR